MDARHTLHNVVDAPLQLGGGLTLGEGVLVADGDPHRQVHQRGLTEQPLELIAGTEGEHQRQHGAIVFHRVLEHRLFQWGGCRGNRTT